MRTKMNNQVDSYVTTSSYNIVLLGKFSEISVLNYHLNEIKITEFNEEYSKIKSMVGQTITPTSVDDYVVVNKNLSLLTEIKNYQDKVNEYFNQFDEASGKPVHINELLSLMNIDSKLVLLSKRTLNYLKENKIKLGMFKFDKLLFKMRSTANELYYELMRHDSKKN